MGNFQMLKNFNHETSLGLTGFSYLLNEFKREGREPVLYWYPSAYKDFTPIFCDMEAHMRNTKMFRYPQDYSFMHKYNYLSREYPELQPPDLYIFTDYSLLNNEKFYIFSDNIIEANDDVKLLDHPLKNRVLIIDMIEKLPKLEVKDFPEALVNSKVDYEKIGSVFYIRVIPGEIKDSKVILSYKHYHVLYVVVENAWFLANILLKFNAKVDYILRKNYGGENGGGKIYGNYLSKFFYDLGTKVFICDHKEPYYGNPSFSTPLDLKVHDYVNSLKVSDEAKRVRVIRKRDLWLSETCNLWFEHKLMNWNYIEYEPLDFNN